MFFKRYLKINKTKEQTSISHRRGFSLVEILIGTSIICVSLILIVNLENGISKIGWSSTAKVQAGMLAEEGISVIRNMRNVSWQDINALNNNVPYRVYWNQTSKSWLATTSVMLIDNKFDRTITFYPVYRDINSFDVVSTGGTVDYGTRKFSVDVSWQDNSGTTTRSLTSYIYNIFNK